MPDVKAVHALQSGRRTYAPGEIVPIADEKEAKELVRVGAAEWPDERDDEPSGEEESDLPADLPGRAALITAGYPTLASLDEVEDLTTIDGIGQKTAEAIEEYLEDEPTGEE